MWFMTWESASSIISRLEEVAACSRGRMHVTKSGARGVRFEGTERGGPRGRLTVAVHIFSVVLSMLVAAAIV
ncbi:CBL-interacting protein kinase 6 [Panicum miliaceum]|uniref:CBL-interacting protein kinase 6 n=1 Tax=Panicum miliaceum TaxID=4540 RepID=A0A3L6Q307_PANMI|nr:CBL-interacting protein kinase 6 [Panicum miliaceum]